MILSCTHKKSENDRFEISSAFSRNLNKTKGKSQPLQFFPTLFRSSLIFFSPLCQDCLFHKYSVHNSVLMKKRLQPRITSSSNLQEKQKKMLQNMVHGVQFGYKHDFKSSKMEIYKILYIQKRSMLWGYLLLLYLYMPHIRYMAHNSG